MKKKNNSLTSELIFTQMSRDMIVPRISVKIIQKEHFLERTAPVSYE